MNEDSPQFALSCKDGDGPAPVLVGVQAQGRLDAVLFELTLRQTYRNPLQREPTPARIQFWEQLIRTCIATPAMPLLPADERAIADAVTRPVPCCQTHRAAELRHCLSLCAPSGNMLSLWGVAVATAYCVLATLPRLPQHGK